MKVFGIGDLHLSSSGKKPMGVFGPDWDNHQTKLQRNWRRAVAEDDLVLICGDLSWAMKLEEARADLDLIDSLPGVKYFIRGNHDYWYSSPGKVRAALGGTMRLIRFDAAVHNGVGICGVRGWRPPWHPQYREEEDAGHWQRSMLRLRMSLDALAELDWDVAVAMFHHPPRSESEGSALSRMIQAAGVRHCIYGHLHGDEAARAFEGVRGGVNYRCVSADRIGFAPRLLFES